MIAKGCGFLPDPDEIVSAQLVAYHARALVGSSASIPEAMSYAFLVTDIANQGSSSSCVGQAFASSIHLRSIVSGSPIAKPSAKAIYDLARMQRDRVAPLFDGGCSPIDAINGMKLSGLVAEERWPLTSENVDVKPDWDIFQHGLDALLGQHYRIAEGRGSAQLIREALAKGYFPTFAMDVYGNYADYDGSAVYAAADGRFIGRHMQCIVGYDGDVFAVLNSWGKDWGQGGFSMMSASFIESRSCNSLLVPTVIPARVS